MEFERAIYRVYERCLDGFRDNEGDVANKYCRIFEYIAAGTTLFFLIILCILHTSYVGDAGCLPQLLSEYAHQNNMSSFTLRDDQLLGINVDYRFSPLMASVERQQMIKSQEDSYERRLRRRLSGISESGSVISSRIGSHWRFLEDKDTTTVSKSIKSHQKNNVSMISNANLTLSQRYDYVFALEYSLVTMPVKMLENHNFEVINITMTHNPACYGPSFAQPFIGMGGFDTVIQNNLMYSLNRGGIMITALNDYYTWGPKDINMYESVTDWLSLKISIIFTSLFSFFALSCTTALLVRVLISSGVVLIFPIFWLFGVPLLNNRIIELSYPWLGIPIEIMRRSNLSPTPFILSHLVKVVVYYLMYEATQLAFATWFYDSRYPGQTELLLFGIMMGLEYYSMIYVRSKLSIVFFPRATLLLFMLYHFYLYSFPAGFIGLAENVMALAMIFLMIFCVKEFEMEAYLRGQVSSEQPRAMYNMMPIPTFPPALPTDDTIFMPVNRQSRSVYDDVPPATADNAATTGTEENIVESAAPTRASDTGEALPIPTTGQDFALMVADEDGIEPGDLEFSDLRGEVGSGNIVSGDDMNLGSGELQSMTVSGGGTGRNRSDGAYTTLHDTSEHHK